MSFNIGDDIIDSRDVEKRIDELEYDVETFRDELQEAVDEASEKLSDLESDRAEAMNEGWATQVEVIDGELEEAREALAEAEAELTKHNELYEDEQEELNKLREFRDEVKPYCPDWRHGATLISEDYFVEYIEERCRECGDVPREMPGYIVNNINWEGVASDLKDDYGEAEIDGYTYLFME